MISKRKFLSNKTKLESNIMKFIKYLNKIKEQNTKQAYYNFMFVNS